MLIFTPKLVTFLKITKILTYKIKKGATKLLPEYHLLRILLFEK